MDILIRLLIALEIIVCLMLIGIILIQKSKGRGLGLSFGGGAAETVFGGQMGNVLTRTTVILAVLFLLNTTLLAVLRPGSSAKSESLVNQALAQQTAEQPAEAAPAPVTDGGLLPTGSDVVLPELGDLADTIPPDAPPEVPATEPETPPEAPATEPETPPEAPATDAGEAPAQTPAEPVPPAAEPAPAADEPAAAAE